MSEETGSSRALLAALRRRHVLEGGLAGFATVMASRLLGGCGDESGADGGLADAGTDGGVDAAADIDGAASDAAVELDASPSIDASADAGPTYFEPRPMPARPALRSRIASVGPLGTADANGVRTPAGFTARILGRGREAVAPSTYRWHLAPDGGATFATMDGGWIYVSNSEVPVIGGVGAMRFSSTGALVDAYRICDRTHVNCAGGPTPWGSWLTCEEVPRGIVYECDPHGERAAVARMALGVFKHEAVTVDPTRHHLYLTEDEPDGRFYRFTPARLTPNGDPDLSAGTLEALEIATATGGAATWHVIPDPQFAAGTPTRMQVAATSVFRGGEGIWFHEDVVYFSTKGDDRIWALDIVAQTVSVLYDGRALTSPPIVGVDNLTVSCCGDVLVAEDGGSMQIVAIVPGGSTVPLVQVTGQPESEITGPAFDPSGTRLYFSSQRGNGGDGITYVIEGPFHEPA